MFWVHVLVLLAIGCLAAAPVLASKNPNLKKLIDQLTPFTGILGIVAFVLGVINAIDLIPSLGTFFGAGFKGILFGTSALLATICELGLGFLLGLNLMDKYVLKGAAAGIATALNPFRVMGGIAAIVVALFWLVMFLTK